MQKPGALVRALMDRTAEELKDSKVDGLLW